MEHVKQVKSQLAHAPLLITNGEGHVVTHVPLYKAALEAQSTQFVIFTEQVAHSDEQLSQVFKIEFFIVIELGQIATHYYK
jgi:hypothetical protein